MRSFFLLVILTLLIGACGVRSEEFPSGQLTANPNNPLLRNGPEEFDYWKTGPRVVLKEGPSNYRMWYEAVGRDGVTRVGYATSSDGLTWTKMGIVMSPEGWERDEVSPNSILLEDGLYKMWYHGGGFQEEGKRLGTGQIGYATSRDGLSWAKDMANPVIAVGEDGSFEDGQVVDARVLKAGNVYRMYYTGQNRNTLLKSLALATSPDGVTWTKYTDNPLLGPDRFGGWGGAFIVHGGIWNLWHARSDDSSGIVYKWSLDGISWNDGPSNPVLVPSGDPSAADSQAVGDSVSGYFDGATYRIMYSGFNSDFRGTGRSESICLATINVTPRKFK
ncbi:MAG: hypothetical protein M3Z09_09735 [Acidobacteriota bacterium]|nr:hypothetical protein [Acidobacteriota bacterium]